jgi:hypothetical protein
MPLDRLLAVRHVVGCRLAGHRLGEIDFRRAKFIRGTVDFADAEFSGGNADFRGAEFSGGEVDFSSAGGSSFPSKFPWTGTPPPGVKLPKNETQSQMQNFWTLVRQSPIPDEFSRDRP